MENTNANATAATNNEVSLEAHNFGCIFEYCYQFTDFCKKHIVTGKKPSGHTYRLFDGMDIRHGDTYSFDRVEYLAELKYRNIAAPVGALELVGL